MYSGASASCIKHDPVEDLVPVCSCPLGTVGLLTPPGPRGCPGDAEEGLGGGGPVPLDVGNIDEQAHTQPQGGMPPSPPAGSCGWIFFSSLSAKDRAAAAGGKRERQEEHVRVPSSKESQTSPGPGTKCST